MSPFWQGFCCGCGLLMLIHVAVTVPIWNRLLSRAFKERRDTAIDNAAMKAYDMGHPDVREQVNALVERGV